jgi:Flp pilus assembly protein TadG
MNAGATEVGREKSRLLRWRRLAEDDRGSSTLEFAILVPAMFLAIFACVQVALWSYGRSIALNAAHQAVNAQRVLGAAPGVGQARAEAFIAAQGDSLLAPKVTVEIRGNEVFATVTGRTLSLVPLFHTDVTQVASGPVEEFRP